ncbi:hypothetical protein Peur_072829 [Populus x canadensis]
MALVPEGSGNAWPESGLDDPNFLAWIQSAGRPSNRTAIQLQVFIYFHNRSSCSHPNVARIRLLMKC